MLEQQTDGKDTVFDLLLSATDSMTDGVLLLDSSGCPTHWNPAFLELTGIPAALLEAGCGLRDLLACLEPRDEALDGLYAALDQGGSAVLAGARLLRLKALSRPGGRLILAAPEGGRGALGPHGINERLVAAIEHLADGFVLFDDDDRVLLCNRRYREMIPGVTDAVEPGEHFTQMVDRLAHFMVGDEALARDWAQERMERHRRGGAFEVKLPDGRWLLVRDAATGGLGGAITLTDISTIKRREQALRESEARFRAIFTHAAVGVAVIEPGGRIAQANAALAAMLGYSPEDMRHLSYKDLVHPDERDLDIAMARKLLSGDIDHYTLEARYLRKDGRTVWGSVTVSLVRGDGLDERFAIALVADIDQRKRAEDDLSMFRSVVEASHEAVAVFAPDGRPIYANSAFERLFALDQPLPGDQQDFTYRELYLPEAQLVIDQEIAPALQRGESWEGVLAAKDRRGRYFPLWQRAGMVRRPNGRPRFYFAFMHDHTPQRLVEDELCKAKEQAEEANLAKTRFLAAASHDLRQPLQALNMFVTVLQARNRDAAVSDLILRIQDSLGAVETLLNGLLDVSKLEAGLVEAAEDNFQVGGLMQRLAAEFQPLAEAEGLMLKSIPCDAMVRSDQALLERVLRNLLNNAIRYTREGRILFGCRRRGDHLRIEVWDTGIGIPKSQLKLIFREFHQLGNPQRDRRQGLGLGLAIVERLGALLGHRILVESTPNRGSMFAIEVPIATGVARSTAPKQLQLAINRTDLALVVIDDEPDVLDSMRLVLESWGHRVLTALDADEALRRLPDLGRAPDLIIADYRLQNGNTGGQAIARIRVRLKSVVPAIIVTGDTAPERLRQAKANGHGLLHKPVHPDALRAAIDEALTRPRSRNSMVRPRLPAAAVLHAPLM